MRAALAQATHEFFRPPGSTNRWPVRSNGFLYVHTPLITAADCEGAGEMPGLKGLLRKEMWRGFR